jgi:hypothetical protein
MNNLASYPTPPGALRDERMNDGFLKLHPGAPVHIFTEARDERFHCHPFNFKTHIAVNSYVEELLLRRDDGTYYVQRVHRKEGTTHEMPAAVPHRLVELPEGFCITRAEYGESFRVSGEYLLQPDGSLLHRYWNEPDWHTWPRA